MTYRFSVDDIAYLSGADDAIAAVDEYALSSSSLVGDLARIRACYGDCAGALVETVRLRRKAVGKLDGTGWLLTDDALQQATPSAVAAHRARRLAGRAVHDVTCSIGAELAALVGAADRRGRLLDDGGRDESGRGARRRPGPGGGAGGPDELGCETGGEGAPGGDQRWRGSSVGPPPAGPTLVIGSDLDEVRLRMAAHNVPGALLVRADALVPCTKDTVVLADPARRVGGRRIADPADLMPPLPALLEVYAGRDLVVKCAPGLDFDALDWPGEIEVTSLDGGVREACLWSPGLSDGTHRRATVLGRYEVTSADPDELAERGPGEWIVNPDGAVIRAGLVRHYAARHGLWQLDPRIAFLTGDTVPAGDRGFRILERLKFSEKTLRQELSRRDCGSLEILVRGVDIDPDALRKRLKLRGSQPLSLVITRIGDSPTVFVCEAGTVGS